eukprot:m.199820 g.199820  ORF g.199820 m.199820 type:complete len:1625 (+) comp15732_c0_seq3:296-5170(+)
MQMFYPEKLKDKKKDESENMSMKRKVHRAFIVAAVLAASVTFLVLIPHNEEHITVEEEPYFFPPATPPPPRFFKSYVTPNEILASTAICVKTFNRPACLENFLKGVASSWSRNVHVLVADDSNEDKAIRSVKLIIDKFKKEGLSISHIVLPHDSGVAYGRIKLVEHAKQAGFKHILMSDDDFEIRTDLILRMAWSMVKVDADILAAVRCDESSKKCGKFGYSGSLFHSSRGVMSANNSLEEQQQTGDLFLLTHVHRHVEIEESTSEGCMQTDLIQNFFLAKVDVLDGVWDPILKNNDHYDFLMSVRKKNLSVFACRNINVVHKRSACTSKKSSYNKLRHQRWGALLSHVLQKWSISSLWTERLLRYNVNKGSEMISAEKPRFITLSDSAENKEYVRGILREIKSLTTPWNTVIQHGSLSHMKVQISNPCLTSYDGYLYLRPDYFLSGNALTTKKKCAISMTTINDACPLLDQMVAVTVTNTSLNRHLYYLTVARGRAHVLEFVSHLQKQSRTDFAQTLCLVYFSDSTEYCERELADKIKSVLEASTIQLVLICLQNPFGRAIGMRRGIQAIIQDSKTIPYHDVVVFALDVTMFLRGSLAKDVMSYVAPGETIYTPIAIKCASPSLITLEQCVEAHASDSASVKSGNARNVSEFKTYWAGSVYTALGFALSDYIHLLDMDEDGGVRQKWWYHEGATEADLVYQFQTSLNLLVLRVRSPKLYTLGSIASSNKQNVVDFSLMTPESEVIQLLSCSTAEQLLLASLESAAELAGYNQVKTNIVLRVLTPPYGTRRMATYYTFFTYDKKLIVAAVPKPSEMVVSCMMRSTKKPKVEAPVVVYSMDHVQLQPEARTSKRRLKVYVTPNEILSSTAICLHASNNLTRLNIFFSSLQESWSNTLTVYVAFDESEADSMNDVFQKIIESGLTIHSIPVSGMAIRTRLLLEAVKSAGFSHVIMTDDTFLIKDDLLLSMARSLHTYSAQVVAPTTCSDNKDPSSCNHEMLGSVLVSESSENGNTVFFLRDFIRNNSQDLQPSTPHTCVRSDLFGLFYLAEIDALWGTNDIDWYGTSQGTQTGRFDMWLTARKRNLAIFNCPGITVQQRLHSCGNDGSPCNGMSSLPSVLSGVMSKWKASDIWAVGLRFASKGEPSNDLISAKTDKSSWRMNEIIGSDEDGREVIHEINSQITAWNALTYSRSRNPQKYMISDDNPCMKSYKGVLTMRYDYFESRNTNSSLVHCSMEFSRLKDTCPVLDQLLSVRDSPSDYDHNQRHLYYLTASSFGNKVLAFAEYLKNQKSAYVGAPVSRTFAVVFYGDDLKHCRNELTIQLQNLLREASVKVLVVCLRMPFGRAIGLRRGMQAILEDSASIAPENVVVFSLDTSIHLKDTVTENAMRYVSPAQTFFAPIVAKCDTTVLDSPAECEAVLLQHIEREDNSKDGSLSSLDYKASWVGVGYGIIAFSLSDYQRIYARQGGYRDIWWYRYGVEDQDVVWQLQKIQKLLAIRPKMLEFLHFEEKTKYTKNEGYYKKHNLSPFLLFTPTSELIRRESRTSSEVSLLESLALALKRANVKDTDVDWNIVLRTEGPKYEDHDDAGKTHFSVFRTSGEMIVLSLNQPIMGSIECPGIIRMIFRK